MSHRPKIDLSGIWRFQPDPGNEGEQLGYPDPDHDDVRWRQARVPGCFDLIAPELADYEGVGWYRRSFVPPASWADRRVVLHFEGVHYHASVWVNGPLVGQHQDGFLPFDLDISASVRYGQPNTLCVRSDNIRRLGDVPGMERGWRTYGGLQRRLELVATAPVFLCELSVDARPGPDGGRLSLHIRAENTSSREAQRSLALSVSDLEGGLLLQDEAACKRVSAGGIACWQIDATVPGVQLWSPSSPRLYRLSVSLIGEGETHDVQELSIGFRRSEVSEGRLLLNGEPVFLTGFNRHEDSADAAMADDLATVRRDLLAMREAGANYVRLCHYPHNPDELSLCDELGLLVMAEIPLYWWRGLADGEEICAAKLGAAERQLAAMIRRDRNHPSVIIWSVSNETEEQRPEVVAGNRRLVKLAHQLDPSRLAVHVSHHWVEHPHFEADDLVCVNAYPSLNRRGYGAETDYDLADSKAYWREGLARLHHRYPDKPILVTEFGYAALEGVCGNGFGVDIQSQAIAAEFAGMDAPYVCGATVWCWADHPWPGNVFGFCHDLAISPYGVVTRDRRRLPDYRTIRAMFRERQGLLDADESALSSAGPAGIELFMIRPSLSDVPDVPFPDGYGIRTMAPDEGGLWTDIQRDAEPYFPVPSEWFVQQFGQNLPAVAWRCFLIVDARGVAVGTVSAWYKDDYHGEPWGQLHWLAIRPAHQRRGLARAAVSYALQQLSHWHERAFLGTQSARLGAIRLYLDMGFVPDLAYPGAASAWRTISQDLDHPALEQSGSS